MGDGTAKKDLFMSALILQFIIILATAYLSYLYLLYPHYSDEFGFGKYIKFTGNTLSLTITTGRTPCTLMVRSEEPVYVYVDGKLAGYGKEVNIKLEEYRVLNLSLVGSSNSVVYLKLLNEVPVFEVYGSLLVLVISLPIYIKYVKELR